jgi:hypothetical protein
MICNPGLNFYGKKLFPPFAMQSLRCIPFRYLIPAASTSLYLVTPCNPFPTGPKNNGCPPPVYLAQDNRFGKHPDLA